MSTLVTNILRKNSAAEHQALATRIATELGVTKASLHYHYPSKAELGQRLIERYEQEFAAALQHDGNGKAQQPRAVNLLRQFHV